MNLGCFNKMRGNMMTKARVEKAMDLMVSGHSCSEALMLSYADAFGLAPSQAMKLASGFAGGMGEGSGTCGVMTAACMVMGLAVGPGALSELSDREAIRMMVNSFREGFLAGHGSLVCMELNGGFDPATPEGKEAIRASGRAPVLVARAVEQIEGLLGKVDHHES